MAWEGPCYGWRGGPLSHPYLRLSQTMLSSGPCPPAADEVDALLGQRGDLHENDTTRALKTEIMQVGLFFTPLKHLIFRGLMQA